MGELIAVRCDPAQTGPVLRALWDRGAAALLLPREGPDATVEQIVTSQRPSAVLDLRQRPDAVPGPTADPAHDPAHLVATERDEDRAGARGAGAREPGTPPVADEVALVVTTSGSTGRPKGVQLTHAALQASTTASVERLGCRPGQRWALALPTHHVAGVQVLLRSWALGTDAEVVDDLGALANCEAQHVSLVPTQLARLLDLGVALERFETVLLGGAAASPELLERARASGARVVVSYGMSETCGGCVYDGSPLDGVEVGLLGGRIRIRGPVLFAGYRAPDRQPSDTDRQPIDTDGQPSDTDRQPIDTDGWFLTGDLGRVVEGRLEVVGRADDVVISGGENVPVAAVEAALRELPGLAEVAVYGRSDPEWGQLVVAVVVPADGHGPPTLDEVRAQIRRRHPAAWAPRQLLVVGALPRDPMGKVRRDALARLTWDPARRTGG